MNKTCIMNGKKQSIIKILWLLTQNYYKHNYYRCKINIYSVEKNLKQPGKKKKEEIAKVTNGYLVKITTKCLNQRTPEREKNMFIGIKGPQRVA